MIPLILPEDVDAVSDVLGVPFTELDRTSVLTATGTVDVWACPGSGKTTTLVAKLYLLASKWTLRHRGICALSHTNVAKDEIIGRIAGTTANRLLQPPHFVDTIQRFVHEFLAIPAAIRLFGVRPHQIISSEIMGAELLKAIQGHKFTSARLWLSRQSNSDAILADVRFTGPGVVVAIKGLKDKTSPSYQQLTEAKLGLAQRGVLSFQDMYSLALWYLETYPTITEILSHRFPIVFFDEMQDTNSDQWLVFERIFARRSVIQRFGDHNQAIYQTLGGGDGCGFPSADHLTMNRSKRLSRSIASLVENLTLSENVPLLGEETRAEKEHCIFLFTEASAKSVLPRFAQHVIEQFPQRPDGFIAAAVGAIGTISTGGAYPAAIEHYWPDFDPASRSNVGPECFADYVQLASVALVSSGSVRRALQHILAGLVEMMRIEGCQLASGRRVTVTSLSEELQREQPDLWSELMAAVVHVLSSPTAGRNVRETLKLCAPCILKLLGRRPVAALDFLKAEPNQVLARAPAEKGRIVYHYTNGSQTIDLRVGTIHSVKGQTHDATLVLETRYYTFDLERLKPFLLGNRPGNVGTRDRDHLRRVYVGVTRPRELLSLAMHRDHLLDQEREILNERGWRLVEI